MALEKVNGSRIRTSQETKILDVKTMVAWTLFILKAQASRGGPVPTLRRPLPAPEDGGRGLATEQRPRPATIPGRTRGRTGGCAKHTHKHLFDGYMYPCGSLQAEFSHV